MAVDTPVPSQFSHEILNANPYAYLDDAPLEERRARAVQMRRMLPESVLEEVGGLDPTAIEQVREEAWPDVRDADELHDVLHTLVAVPEAGLNFGTSQWKFYFERLIGEGRAASATLDGRVYWVAAERAKTFRALFPEARFEPNLAEVEATVPTRDDALLTLVAGWMSHLGPTTATGLGEPLKIPAPDISGALLRMEASGTVLRGNFSGTAVGLRSTGQPGAAVPTEAIEIEWCERRLLARIHRLTVATLRKQIEPVTAAQFMQWLLQWQHVAPGTQVSGERGTLEVLRQLQGFEIPANAWERQVLARRVVDYDPKWLDQLCLTGAVGWGRLSPHPATLDYSNASRANETESGVAPRQRRVIPTSVAPITFFIREDADWMTPRHPGAELDKSLWEQRPEPQCATGSRFLTPAWCFVLCRYRSWHGETESGDRDRALGTGSRRVGDRRWLRQSAVAHRSQAAGRTGQWADGASEAQRWTVGNPACGRSGRAITSRRSSLLDAITALRHSDSGRAGARGEPATVARAVDGLPSP